MEKIRVMSFMGKQNIAMIGTAMSMFKATPEQAKQFIKVMSTNKLSKSVNGSEYAWALYIRTGANKEGSFEDYLKHNKIITGREWDMLNQCYDPIDKIQRLTPEDYVDVKKHDKRLKL